MRTISHLLLGVFLVACGGGQDKPAAAPAAPEAAPVADEAAGSSDPAATTPGAQPAETAEPGTLTAEDHALAQRALAYFDELGKGVAAAGSDCAQVAASMEATAAKHDTQALFAEMKRLDDDQAKTKALEEKYASDFEAAFMPLMQALPACQDDPAVQQAVQKALPQ